jgi:hypothetical protein
MIALMLLGDAERLGIVTPWTDHISTGCCCFGLLDQFPQVCGLEDSIESVFWYDFSHGVGLGSSPENPAVLATAGRCLFMVSVVQRPPSPDLKRSAKDHEAR